MIVFCVVVELCGFFCVVLCLCFVHERERNERGADGNVVLLM